MIYLHNFIKLVHDLIILSQRIYSISFFTIFVFFICVQQFTINVHFNLHSFNKLLDIPLLTLQQAEEQ